MLFPLVEPGQVNLILKVGRMEIIRAAFLPAAVDFGCNVADARTIAVESRKQSRLIIGSAGHEPLQGFGADEERRFHRLVIPPKAHRVARDVKGAAGVGKVDCHGDT
jgi:hypothetical protein